MVLLELQEQFLYENIPLLRLCRVQQIRCRSAISMSMIYVWLFISKSIVE